MEHKIKYIRVDSDKRDNKDNDTNSFDISFSHNELQNVKRISLLQASIPNVQYNVFNANNFITLEFEVYDAGVLENTYVIELDGKNYDVNSIKTAIETKINNILVPFSTILSISNDEEYSKFSFNLTGGSVTKIILLSEENATTEATLNEIIGVGNQNVEITINTQLPNIYNLLGLNEVFLHIKKIANSISLDKTRQFSSIIRIPITSSFGSITHYTTPDENIFSLYYPDQNNLQSLTIRLRDRNGNLIQTQNTRVFFLFKIWY